MGRPIVARVDLENVRPAALGPKGDPVATKVPRIVSVPCLSVGVLKVPYR